MGSVGKGGQGAGVGLVPPWSHSASRGDSRGDDTKEESIEVGLLPLSD